MYPWYFSVVTFLEFVRDSTGILAAIFYRLVIDAKESNVVYLDDVAEEMIEETEEELVEEEKPKATKKVTTKKSTTKKTTKNK